MTVMIVGGIVLAAVLVACVVVLTRRGRTGAAGSHGTHGTSAAELDASARSASARGSDRQGTGPF